MDPKLVREARDLEMEFFKAIGVCFKVPRSEQRKCNGRLIDIHKGDVTKPNYRRRLAGKDFRTHADDAPYASIPPLEALRLIVSRAATTDKARHIMMNDVRRACFYAEASRDIFIELPEEDETYGKGDPEGKLKLCLYGTRGAALNWQQTLSEHLLENCFKRGIGFPSVPSSRA